MENSKLKGTRKSLSISRSRSDHGLNDTGVRESFASGMIREPNLLRGRFDLISPIALRKLAIHYDRGCMKYSERNWEKGGPHSRHLNSAMRHLQDYLEGDRKEDHLSASAWNVFCILHNQEMIDRGLLPSELNDLPCYTVEGRNNGTQRTASGKKIPKSPANHHGKRGKDLSARRRGKGNR